MPDQDVTLNQGGQTDNAAGASSVPEVEFEQHGDLIATIPTPVIPQSGKDGKDGDTDAAAKDTGGRAKDAGGKKDAEEDVPFHEHPRFKELHRRAKEAETRLETITKEFETLKQTAIERTAPKDKAPSYKDIAEMPKEELIEWMDTDPKGYAKNLMTQIVSELRGAMDSRFDQQHQAITEEVRTAEFAKQLNDYASKFPDNEEKTGFDQMWDAGEIQAVLEENRGMTPMAAHRLLMAEKQAGSAAAKIKAEVEKAKKETEERLTKSFRAKGDLRTLGKGTDAPAGGRVHEMDQRLKDSKPFGGRTNVLLQRLLERRNAQG